MSSPSKTPIKRTDIVLLLLHADSGYPIDGNTRFEKLIFLIQKEIIDKWDVVMSSTFNYEPDRFGPLATEMYDEIAYLKENGMLEEIGRNRFKITRKGVRFVEQVITRRVPQKIMEAIDAKKRTYDKVELNSLLRYVYLNYPAYTEKSEIRDKVLG